MTSPRFNDDEVLKQATELYTARKYQEAITALNRISSTSPLASVARILEGFSWLQLEKPQEAQSCLEPLRTHPNFNTQCIMALAIAKKKLGRNSEAKILYGQVPEESSDYGQARFNLGNVYLAERDYRKAAEQFQLAIACDSTRHDFWNNLGRAHQLMAESALAENAYRQAIKLCPTFEGAYHNLSLLLVERGRSTEAIDLLNYAISVLGPSFNTLVNLAHAHRSMGNRASAENILTEAIEQEPENPIGHYNLGELRMQVRDFDGARLHFLKALQNKTNWIDARLNLASCYMFEQKHASAEQELRKLLHIAPGNSAAQKNLAKVLNDQGRLEEALNYYTRIAIPGPSYCLGERLYLALQLCNWKDFYQLRSEMQERIQAMQPVATPFVTTVLFDSPELQLRAARRYCQDKLNGVITSEYTFRENRTHASQQRIKLAYVSADFFDHATTHLVTEVIEAHDKEKFDIHLVSLAELDLNDPYTRRLVRATSSQTSVANKSFDSALAELRTLELDIAVDMKGFTKNSWAELFAHGIAPRQVSYLGYPGTTAIPKMTHLIADEVIIPPEQEHHYSEKILRLPHCYQPNLALCNRDIQRLDQRLAKPHLTPTGFVYCSFNNHYKINPDVLDDWSEILRNTPESKLWLLVDQPIAQGNLALEFQARGIPKNRVVFKNRLPRSDYLDLMARAHLFLDTYPCTAHTTASDALRAGLPVLTLCGRSMVARVAASLLTTLGMQTLISPDRDRYKQNAIALYSSPDLYEKTNAELNQAVRTSLLYRPDVYVRNLEALFESCLN